jgi:hypothetical protein
MQANRNHQTQLLPVKHYILYSTTNYNPDRQTIVEYTISIRYRSMKYPSANKQIPKSQYRKLL